MSRFYTPREGAWLGREEDDPARTAPDEEADGCFRAECARLSERAVAAEESAARAWERLNEMRGERREAAWRAVGWGVLAAVVLGAIWRWR